MPVPSARALLREIDRLPAPERTRRLALLARDEKWTTELEVLTADLAAGDPFARRLALLLAAVGENPEIVARLMDDPDPGIAGSAVAAAARMWQLNGVLLDRLPRFSRLQRRGLQRTVRRHVLGTLADSLLEPVREHFGDVECAALLSGCTTSTVRVWLPELAYAVRNWAGLAHRHPDAVLAHLRRELAAAPAMRAAVWSRTAGAAAPLAVTHPDDLLNLLELSVADAPLPQELGPVWGALARHDRERVVRLLRDPRRTGSTAPTGRPFWRTLGDAADADVAAVARDVGTRALPRFLAALPPSRRPVAVAGLAEGGRLPLPLALTVADLLSATARHAVAARLLDRAEVADDPRRRLTAVARQPWLQARDTLRAATTHPDAADRAAAYAALLTAATLARDPAVLSGTLGELGRLRNEQDPVRCAALTALRRVPSWQVRRDDLAEWVGRCHDATQARDASPATLAAVSAIAGSLLREGAIRGDAALTDAAATLVGALGQHRVVAVRAAARDLPRGAEKPLVAALLPRLESDATQGRFTTALALAAALDRRAWEVPELQSLVDRARGAADDATVRTAIGLWLAPHRTRSARVAAVLAADPSTIVLPSVAAVVQRSRTDLLDTVLKRPPRGRFLSGPGHHVPEFSPAPGVWLPRQVRAYAALLEDIVAGTARPAWERCWAVRRRARLPGAVPLLRRLGDLGPDQEAVAEAALAALGHTDDPRAAVAALLRHVDGDRARVAVPAVRRCLDALPPELVGDPLARLLGSPKVTTRKDALRLVALHRRPGAGRELLARLTDPDEHRDVRRAAVPAARSLLDGREAAVVRPGLQVAVDEPVLAPPCWAPGRTTCPSTRGRRTAGSCSSCAIPAGTPTTSARRWAPSRSGRRGSTATPRRSSAGTSSLSARPRPGGPPSPRW